MKGLLPVTFLDWMSQPRHRPVTVRNTDLYVYYDSIKYKNLQPQNQFPYILGGNP